MGHRALYVGGSFWEITDINPGDSEDERSSNGVTDAFVLKLSLDGVYEWVWTAGGTEADVATGIAVSGDGAVTVTGLFGGGPVDFDGGDGIDERFSNGLFDSFVTKLSSDGSYL